MPIKYTRQSGAERESAHKRAIHFQIRKPIELKTRLKFIYFGVIFIAALVIVFQLADRSALFGWGPVESSEGIVIEKEIETLAGGKNRLWVEVEVTVNEDTIPPKTVKQRSEVEEAGWALLEVGTRVTVTHRALRDGSRVEIRQLQVLEDTKPNHTPETSEVPMDSEPEQ